MNSIEQKFIQNNYASTYGELTRQGLNTLLHNKNLKNKVFYDLGSGKGNVVIYAAQDYPQFKKCNGIEFHDERHNEALINLQQNTDLKPLVSFVHGDILKQNLSDGDFFYISNLCFNQSTNLKIYDKLKRELKQNATVFCSRPICNKNIKPNKTVKQTWWENSDIYEYKKLGKKLIPVNSHKTKHKHNNKTKHKKTRKIRKT